MSHFFNAVGKVFSSVWNFIRPIVEVVAIAAVIYFTAGVALSAFPSTAGFAAAMPGFASTGGVAGEGVFSSLASQIGIGGGLASGATADAAAVGADAASVAAGGLDATPFAAAPSGAGAGTAVGAGSVGADVPDIAVGETAAAPSIATTPLAPVPPPTGVLPPVVPPTPPVDAALAASNALTNKLLLASVGTQLISGLSSPSPTDIASAKAGFYGSFYGTNANGSGSPAPSLSVGPQSEPMPGVNVPTVQASTPAPGVPGFQGTQKPQLIPTVPVGTMPVPGAAATNAVSMVPGTTTPAQPKLITTPA
jgi:hypothetical protein